MKGIWNKLKKRFKNYTFKEYLFILLVISFTFVGVSNILENTRGQDFEIKQKILNYVKKYDKQVYIGDINKEFIENNSIIGMNTPGYEYTNYFEITVINNETNELEIHKVYKTLADKWEDYKENIAFIESSVQENKGIGLQVPESNILLEIFVQLLSMILLLAFLMWFMRKSMMAGDSDSKIQTYSGTKENSIKFDNIGGIESQKEEIISIVDTIKNIKKFKQRGVRVPRGMLLYGPPGVGKTMIAKAIAGEVGIDLFIAKGIDFKSKFYGQGSKNVDKAFKTIEKFLIKHSKEVAILFIDEIENLLRERGTAHSADDDIVNTFLDKIDGISGHSNIILIGATNHIDKIDPAARSRFDMEIGFDLPNQEERIDIIEKILEKRLNDDPKLKVSKNLDKGLLASYTTGKSGRFIESIINEAHIRSIKEDKKITTNFIMDVWEDRSIGKEKIKTTFNETDANTVVIHEIGHGIVGHMEGKRIVKLTNIPRGRALGICFSIPKTEETLKTPENLIREVRQLFAGRIAEEVFTGRITTGASNDLEKVEQLLFDHLIRYDFKYNGKGLNYVLDVSMINNPMYMADVKRDTKDIIQDIFVTEQEHIRKFFKTPEVQAAFKELHTQLLEKRNLLEEDFNTIMDNHKEIEDIYINIISK